MSHCRLHGFAWKYQVAGRTLLRQCPAQTVRSDRTAPFLRLGSLVLPEIPRCSSIPPVASSVQVRGAKHKSTIQLGDLPQGPIHSDGKGDIEPDNGPPYPTVVQQARNNMLKFGNCVVLTRVGGFYEVVICAANVNMLPSKTNIALF